MAQMPASKVKPLQEMLNKVVKPKPELKVDGVLGKNTVAALKEFQKRAGLRETGEVDAETAPAVARAMKTGKIEKDQPTVFVPLGGGKYAGFTEREWKTEEKKMADRLLSGPVREAKMNAAAARAAWDHFDDLNRDQYIVSFLIEATRRVSLPPESLIKRAEKAAMDLEALAKAQDFAGFSRRTRSAAAEINEAVNAMRAYREEMIDGGGNWVTGLEVTKWASFTFLSVYAAPVVAAELSAGAVASAMIGGAAVKGLESAAGEIGNWTAGNAQGQDPGGMVSRVLIDTGVGAITGLLSKGGGGGKSVVEGITGSITEKITAKLAADGLSKKVIEKVVEKVINEGGKKALEGAVADAARAIKGDPKMTVKEFASNVAANFMKGVALGNFTKWAGKWIDPKKIPFSDELQKKLRTSAEKDILNWAGGTVHVEKFLKDSQALIDKTIADIGKKALAKVVEKGVPIVIDKVKSLDDEKALDKAMEAEVATPQLTKEITDELVKVLKKEYEKEKKKGK